VNAFKKSFWCYALVWVLLLALYNVIVFLPPWDPARYTPSFWIGYGVVTAALVGQLASGWLAFRPQRAEALLYRLSLVSVNYACAVVMAVAGTVFTLLSAVPWWVAAVVCALLLVCMLAVNVSVVGAARYVERVDAGVRSSSAFVRELTLEAQSLLAAAQGGPCEADARSVYEALRYADPRSVDGVQDVEARLRLRFEELKGAVGAGRQAEASALAREVCLLAKERADRCLTHKR
jgi:hypothetical protein